jgi:hypothetical protein
LIVHLSSEHVGRQQVRRELDAMERRVDRFSERSNRERLGKTWHALEQDMSAREEADEQPVDHVILPHNATRNLPSDVLYQPRVRRG